MARQKKKRKYDELNALKGRIREMGMTYRSMAAEMNMGVNTLSNKINGFQAFTMAEAGQICELLDITPADMARFFLPSTCKLQVRKTQVS